MVFVVGPTASGKTGLAVRLAQHFNTAIISADSRQFYTQIPIGTAQPDASEQKEVQHHFIGNLALDETWSAASFAAATDTLLQESPIAPFPIIVGGSGLYLKALEYELDAIPNVPAEIRTTLQQELQMGGLLPLIAELKTKDPKYFEKVDSENPQRVVRALEVIRHTNVPFSSFLNGAQKRTDRNIIKIAVDWPREELYARINTRVDQMFEQGLEKEARSVFHLKHLNSLNTVGYKELFMHFEGVISLTEAKDLIQQNTRRFAKRQLTWFRRDKEIHWIAPTEWNQAKEIIASWNG